MYKNIKHYKNIKFLDCETIEVCNSQLNIHKKLYNLCKRHNAVLDFRPSDINLFIQNGSQKLIDKIKKIPQYFNPQVKNAGVDFHNKEKKEIIIW